MAIIEVKSLSKVFGPDAKRALPMLRQGRSKDEIARETRLTVAVNRVSFEVQQGEIFVIMGLSGSGKSTLVRLLNRLIEPTDGTISIHGQDIVKLDAEQLRTLRRQKISMIFQKFALFPHRTVRANVEYGLEVQGIDKRERTHRAEEALEVVGLAQWADRYPDELSGGMQQRVGLARGLANNPDILLMDEAFSALDPLIRKDMQDELIELQAKMQKTIIFITHDLDEALRIGDRIALMKDGAVVQIGTPDQILTNPANAYVEKFVEDVNLSKVLTAAQVMVRAETINPDRGPRVALQMMRDRGISNLYIVGKDRKLLGVVTAEQASDALKRGLTLQEVADAEETLTTAPDTPLQDLFDTVSSVKVPLAVVDDKYRLLGVIIRGAVLAALAGNHEEMDELRVDA